MASATEHYRSNSNPRNNGARRRFLLTGRGRVTCTSTFPGPRVPPHPASALPEGSWSLPLPRLSRREDSAIWEACSTQAGRSQGHVWSSPSNAARARGWPAVFALLRASWRTRVSPAEVPQGVGLRQRGLAAGDSNTNSALMGHCGALLYDIGRRCQAGSEQGTPWY